MSTLTDEECDATAERQRRSTVGERLGAGRDELAAALERLPAGVLITEGPAGIVFANEPARTLLASLKRHDETQPISFEGERHDGQPYAADDWPLRRSFVDGEIVTGEEFRLLRSDGGSLILRISSRPLPSIGDAPRRTLAVLEDVTKERATEAAYRALVERSLQGFALFRAGKLLFANERFAAPLGYTPDELLAMPPWAALELVHPDDREMVRTRHLTREAGGSVPAYYRVRVYDRRNRVRWLELAASLVDLDGEPATQLSSYDVTEHVELEEQLHRAQHFEAIGQLAAGIAHEINTPAQYAVDNVQFALDHLESLAPAAASSLGSDLSDALNDALEGLKRITTVVHAVRAFSHPGAEQSAATDLAALIDRALDVTRNEWKYSAEIARSYADDVPPVPCRQGEFGQALLNLIVNAAQAIRQRQESEADVRGRIEITTARQNGDVMITIKDNGIGIPREQQRRVFEPFFTNKGVGEGTGYGLSQVYSTVRSHGGSVWLDSAVNVGTALMMRLPIEPPAKEGEPA